ncbi:MAG: rane protein involved in D-alanine export [Chthoniobacter sp.]|jgi:membrane protein involved in D-alanine export|nr:rane protein involved in D-alanine export [Chthoniobacter sp.]
MAAYADFPYFGLLLLYIVIPTIVLGLFGRANACWALFATALVCVVQFSDELIIRPGWQLREIWIVLGYAVWQWVVAWTFLRWKTRPVFYAAMALALLPLLVAKYLPHIAPGTEFGFAGISYVTFRALDVIFSIHDGVLKAIAPMQFVGFLFFFPTISSGPIDRYRRFTQDWQRRRTRAEFLGDLDTAVERIFRGFLYKFIIAALIRTYWVDRMAHGGALHVVSYMYGYSVYLFFDFAGYSAFAIGFSYLLGIRSPENFHLPFLAKNIRDFWNRWHISLSFWFRDHVYMRFLLTAAKGKWFKGKHTANYLGLFLTFGLMGVWHGTEMHYLIYGLYHAALLCGYDWFARWNKKSKLWGEGPGWRFLDIVLTIHVVCFGLLIFSGRLAASKAAPEKVEAPAAAATPHP